MRFKWWLAGLMLVASAAVQADVVWLKNGDRVTGQVDSIDGSAVRIRTDWGGTLRVKRDKVASIETERVLNIELPDGQARAARLERDEEGRQQVASDERTEALDFEQIRQASVDRLPGEVDERWETRLTYGLNISSGNTDTESHSLRASSLLRQTSFRHQGRAEVDVRKDDGTSTRESYRVGYQLDWFFRDDWFAFGSTEYFQDKLRDVDYRVRLGGGLGYQLWETSLGSLSVEAGISEVIERVGDETENNRAGRWALDYNRYFMGRRLEAFHNHELLVLADRDRGELINTSTGLRYALNAFLSADLRIDLDYETDPAPDRKNTDITYIIGVGFTW